MKIVEDYAQRKVDEALAKRNMEIVIKLDKEGFSLRDIAEIADVSFDFARRVLSE